MGQAQSNEIQQVNDESGGNVGRKRQWINWRYSPGGVNKKWGRQDDQFSIDFRTGDLWNTSQKHYVCANPLSSCNRSGLEPRFSFLLHRMASKAKIRILIFIITSVWESLTLRNLLFGTGSCTMASNSTYLYGHPILWNYTDFFYLSNIYFSSVFVNI
jgi:hypothetical protein